MSNGETKNGLLVEKQNDTGRPTYTDEQYHIWLESMRPHLAKGCSLYYAIQQTALLQFKDSIYRKYAAKDWFCEKVDEIRSTVGDIINNFHINEALRIADKAKQDQKLTKEEYDEMRFVAGNHRLAQSFFVNRTESREAKEEETGKIIEPKPAVIQYDKPEKPKDEEKKEEPVNNSQQPKDNGTIQQPTPSEDDGEPGEVFDAP